MSSYGPKLKQSAVWGTGAVTYMSLLFLSVRLLQQSTSSAGSSPNTLLQIVTAAIGAFIAYYLWNLYNTPIIVPADSSRRQIEFLGDSTPAQHGNFLTFKNIGKSEADACRATLWLKGEISRWGEDDKYIFLNLPVCWMNLKGELLANQAEDYTIETRIPPSAEATAHPFTQKSGYVIVNDWTNVGRHPIIKLTENDQGIDPNEVGNKVIFNDASAPDNGSSTPFVQESKLDFGELRDITWEEAEMTVEVSNGPNIRTELELEFADQEFTIEYTDTTKSTWFAELLSRKYSPRR